MLKLVVKIWLLFVLLIVVMPAFAQHENDTIRIDCKELLLLNDTIYYGTHDSIIVIDKNTDYKILKNSFIRDKDFYEKHPEKKDDIEESENKFKKFVVEQIYNTKEIIPKGFNPSDDYFKEYEGKIIKDIYYNQVQVLDGNVYDTTKTTSTGFGRFLNKSYAPTKKRVLENNVKFNKNDEINSRIISDNERILRNLPYVEEAKIYVVPVAHAPDSVNIFVVTKDKYPIGISGDIKDYNYFVIEPYTRNFLGLGHRLGAIFQYDGDEDPKMGYGLNYLADNVMGTFSNAEVGYFNSYDDTYFRMKLEKPFQSTDTKFGGEFAYENVDTYRYTLQYSPDSVYETKNDFKATIYDFWLGYSIFTSRDITKPFLNIAARYFHERYTERPDIDPENNFDFHNKNNILGAVSYQKVSYFETTKLLNFGRIEYVPAGFNLSFTAGWQSTSFYDRLYTGIGANYSLLKPKAGIFAALVDFGGYYRNSGFEDFVTNLKFTYFSPLIPVKRFELRNVFSLVLNNTINPLYHHKITFGDELTGFDESELYGNGTFVLSYQPIFYAPYEVLGFNFSCNPFIDLGWISKSDFFGGAKQFYSVYGLGLSVKNESLIFPAMNMIAGYYPNGTADGGNFGFEIVFRDYKILDFFSDLKPRTAGPEDFY